MSTTKIYNQENLPLCTTGWPDYHNHNRPTTTCTGDELALCLCPLLCFSLQLRLVHSTYKNANCTLSTRLTSLLKATVGIIHFSTAAFYTYTPTTSKFLKMVRLLL